MSDKLKTPTWGVGFYPQNALPRAEILGVADLEVQFGPANYGRPNDPTSLKTVVASDMNGAATTYNVDGRSILSALGIDDADDLQGKIAQIRGTLTAVPVVQTDPLTREPQFDGDNNVAIGMVLAVRPMAAQIVVHDLGNFKATTVGISNSASGGVIGFAALNDEALRGATVVYRHGGGAGQRAGAFSAE